MHGSRADVGDDADDTPRRLTAAVAGPAIAAGAISLGLVLIGACGLGHHDVYVAPPPMNPDVQTATGTRAASATSYVVVIPPSPSWRVAVNTPPRRTPTTAPSSTGDAPYPAATPPYQPTYAAPPVHTPPTTSTTDPFDGYATTTSDSPAPTTAPQSPPHRVPSDEGDN